MWGFTPAEPEYQATEIVCEGCANRKFVIDD